MRHGEGRVCGPRQGAAGGTTGNPPCAALCAPPNFAAPGEAAERAQCLSAPGLGSGEGGRELAGWEEEEEERGEASGVGEEAAPRPVARRHLHRPPGCAARTRSHPGAAAAAAAATATIAGLAAYTGRPLLGPGSRGSSLLLVLFPLPTSFQV